MLVLTVVLLLTEILTILALRAAFRNIPKPGYYLILFLNLVISIYMWILLISVVTYKGDFDTPGNISLRMNIAGMISGVLLPRMIIIFFHFTGMLFRLRIKGHSQNLTIAGLALGGFIFVVVALSTFIGRFNFKTENVEVAIEDLPPELEGLRIVHLSDMHLATFYNHYKKLEDVVNTVNGLNPDLILNTGDFISYGWKEYDRCDTILRKSISRFGNFAVLGNHDMGTYFPNSPESGRDSIIIKMKSLIAASGYKLLDNENVLLKLNNRTIAIAGIETAGRFPEMAHTDPGPALEGTDSADIRILLLHDPNQWRADVCRKSNVELSLGGHTHGMQIGIITKNIKWSPAKRIYPEWNGLFSDGAQYLYVNRGLGVLSVPFRIWMPPEITLIILKRN